MDSVEKLTSDGLSDMQSVRYLEAANKFDSALSKLWPCHRDTPLEHWIEIHRGHALVRAGLLQRPALEYGKNPHDLLQKSFDTFDKCVKTLQALDLRKILNSFNRSLLFSGWLGLAWISFFRGNMADAEIHIERAAELSKSLDRKYFRADRDIDTNFLRLALCREIGTLPDDFEHLCQQFGYKLSKYEVDKIHVGALDNVRSNLEGNLEQSVAIANDYYRDSTEDYDLTNDTFESVDFMHQFEAGCVGDTWFTVGAYQQARVAYECAYGSESVLVRAAASVGLGNVLMRLSVVKMEASASVGNGVTAKRSGTEVDESSSGFASAEMKYKEALKIYDELGFKVAQIIVLCNLGNLYHKRKELEKAFYWFTTALEYCSGKMDRSSAALHLHLKLAELYLDMEKWVEAFDSIVKAEENLPASNKLARTWVEHFYGSYYLEKAMVTESKAEQLSNLAEARNHLCNAVSVSAEIQQSAGTYTSLRTYTIFEQQKETYALLLWCLALQLDAGTNVTSVAEILVWCERGRSRVSLSEMWNDINHFPIIRKYISEVTDLDALQATAATAFDTLPYEQSWKHLQVLLSRCKLPPATTVVEYALCADFGFLIFVLDVPGGEPKMLRVSFKDQELNGEKLDREKLTAVVNRTVSLLHPKPPGEDDKEAEANLRFFYKLLIKSVEKWLVNTQQIIVIPHEVTTTP
jgi:tetratricopeptide (TPR) repeat protein